MNPARHLRSFAPSADDTDEAFVRLLTETQTDLLAYVLCLVPADREAEDIVQRCNIVLWRKRSSFEPGSNFKAWAFAVARWEVLAIMKERRSRSWLVFEDEVAELIGERMAGTTEDNADGLVRNESLQACLNRLSPAHRQMIIERYAEGYSVQDCARRHHRSAAGLRVTLHRLRQILRRCLDQTSFTPGK